MGAIEFMAIGNPIPDMALTMGSAPGLAALMLAMLGVTLFGILRAIPSRQRVRVLRLMHAEGH